MFGLINVAIQSFVEDSYGRPVWENVVRTAGLDLRDFEAMLPYPDEVTEAVLGAAASIVENDRSSLLQDLGTYLVTHKNMEAVRRLLRYGGREFEEFLISLDELSDRVRIAIPDLEMPDVNQKPLCAGQFLLTVTSRAQGFGSVLKGVVQGLADDYGALILVDLEESKQEGMYVERLHVELLELAFGQDRGLDLAAGMRSQ